jgi:hypothetical protein
MSSAALDWMAGLGPHLGGQARDVLWAGANRANKHGNLVTMGERRWSAEAYVDRKHLRRILARLVELKVLEVAQPAAGKRPAAYRFTLRAGAGLPARLTFKPEPEPFGEASRDGVRRAREALANHHDDGALVGASDAPTTDAGGPALVGASEAASGGISGRLRGHLTPPKPFNQEPPPSGGRVPGGESNERAARPASGGGAGRQGTQPDPLGGRPVVPAAPLVGTARAGPLLVVAQPAVRARRRRRRTRAADLVVVEEKAVS